MVFNGREGRGFLQIVRVGRGDENELVQRKSAHLLFFLAEAKKKCSSGNPVMIIQQKKNKKKKLQNSQ